MNDSNPYQAPDSELVAPENSEFPLTAPQKRSIGEGWQWISSAFSILFHNYWIWLLMGIVFVLIMAAAQLVPMVGGLAASIFWPVFVAGVMWAGAQMERTGQVKFEHLFAGFSRESSSLMIMGAIYLGFTILTMVITVVIMMLIMGMAGGFELAEALFLGDSDLLQEGFGSSDIWVMILLFSLISIALTLPIMMALWFAPALTIIHGVPPFEAMKQSFKGCLKNIIPFLWYSVIGFGLLIAGTIPLGLGLFVVLPMLTLSQYTSYKSVFATTDS